MKTSRLCLYLLLLGLAACAPLELWGYPTRTLSAAATTAPAALATGAPATASPEGASASTAAPAVAVAWQELPVVPVVSERMRLVYQAGLAAGHDPLRFSKIGDCQNITTYFLAIFDRPEGSPDGYRLGEGYAYLQPAIDHFAGSWSRESQAVRGGLNVAAAMNPLWADADACESGETPVACELRLYNPSLAIVSMEESWTGDLVRYETYLRQIVDYVLSQNVVPILATRAEPLEDGGGLNEVVARVAQEYDVPLWNFWRATTALPDHGLTGDGFHLTLAASIFDDPERMENGWPWRNLTALQAVDAVWRGLGGTPAAAAATPAPLSPEEWQQWPVVPQVRPEMRTVFERGLQLGNDPAAFSKVGDGEISAVWFLTEYDGQPGSYDLGEHEDLLAVIDHFQGSFGRTSRAAGRGYNTVAILGPSDGPDCQAGESRLDCELRIHQPSFAILSLGTNQVWQPEVFEPGLRAIVERLLEQGVVPILATKADNLEGDGSINRIIAGLADEYDVPLWNFWLAVQPLPDHGLQADREHLTYAGSDFSDPLKMEAAWPWRNLTALRVLEAVVQALDPGP